MLMTSELENPVPELVEMQAELVQYYNDAISPYELLVYLRIHEDEIDTDNGVFRIGMKRATLALKRYGFDIKPGTRFGEEISPTTTQRQIQTSKTTIVSNESTKSKGSKVGAKASSIPELSGEASGSFMNKEGSSCEASTSEKIRHNHFVIKAIGNDRWIISEHDSKPLNKTYINNATLCELILKDRSNKFLLELVLLIKQKDLTIDFDPSCLTGHIQKKFPNSNKKRIVDILLAKGLNECSPASKEQYNGVIFLSRVVLNDD